MGVVCYFGDVLYLFFILIVIGIFYNIVMNVVRLSVGCYIFKKDIDFVIDDFKVVVEFF